METRKLPVNNDGKSEVVVVSTEQHIIIIIIIIIIWLYSPSRAMASPVVVS
jgi:hypothetical protein